MLRAIASSSTGLLAQQARMDVTANNLANVQTTGFKAGRASFADLLYDRLAKGNTPLSGDAVDAQVGSGARVAATLRDFAPGMPLDTGRALDIYIDGEGFFAVQPPDGDELLYTRDGTLYCGQDGNLVTAAGDVVAPGIQVPEDAAGLSIASDGTVTVRSGEDEVNGLGRISLFFIPNPGGLDARGNNLFAVTEASGDAVEGAPGDEGLGRVQSGRLEASNVDLATEMANMIESYRAFQVNARMVQTGDEMWAQANRLRD